MNTYTIRGRALPAAALLIALVAAVAIVASGALGRAGDPGSSPIPTDRPSPAPTATPSPSPTPDPTPDPTAEPSAEPSDEPADGVFDVDLSTPDNHEVAIVIDDETGTIVGATSGNPGDGMSVRWFDMKVENVDPRTLQLTWVGLPFDEELKLFVSSRTDGKLRLRMVQSGPPLNSDAIGFDRVLNLTFDEPVSAEDVAWSIQESLDTAD